ncbi:MAG: hypothetical protein IIC01_08475, partial [Planctomycetes bacterium]|nr:hypothetical protein [Planctomycetota bacterium]
ADLCRCVSNDQCDDGETCTADRCVDGDCVNRPIPHGDIFPCEGDGVVDIDDIVAILNAFSQGEPVCPSPCASGAASSASRRPGE